MNDYKNEAEEWKALLEAGEIDEQTYNDEITRLMNKKNNTHNNDILKTFSTYNLPLILIKIVFVLIIIIVGFIIFKIFSNTNFSSDFSDPIQTPAQGSKTINLDDGTKAKLTYVAKYKITGIAVATHSYQNSKILTAKSTQMNLFNEIASTDIGIAWGTLAKDKTYSNISWSISNRFLYSHYTQSSLDKIGGIETLSYSSNNHLIPSSPQIKSAIKKIIPNDNITIEGYLVNVSVTKNNTNYTWLTSTSRTDTGEGSCEIIYVTKVK